MKAYKHIAAMSETVWSGVYIISIDSDMVTFQYGYQGINGMIYERLQTRWIEYTQPDWKDDNGNDRDDEPYFTYRGSRYWIADFMVLT